MNGPVTIHRIDTTSKMIAFTFDDGPDPVYTPQLLDIFREAGGKATFFMIGQQILVNRAVAEAVHAEGHEIGNHTYSHPHLTLQTKYEAAEEISRTDLMIRSVTQAAVRTFRPPYLDMNDEILSMVDRAGYAAIGAVNLDARDWEQPGVGHILDATRPHAGCGSILLFHDGYGDRSQTVEAVRVLVRERIADGYRLVTVRELLEYGKAGRTSS